MIYKVVSIVCDEIDKGFNVAYVELQFNGGKWEHDHFIVSAFDYPIEWRQKLPELPTIAVPEFIKRHDDFGNYLSGVIIDFIKVNQLEFRVQLISLKGFDVLNYEFGNAGSIAALTDINVVADIRGIDAALGGNGSYVNSVAAYMSGEQHPTIQLALLAVLRWREENNFLASATGAKRNSIGGAVWIGQEA